MAINVSTQIDDVYAEEMKILLDSVVELTENTEDEDEESFRTTLVLAGAYEISREIAFKNALVTAEDSLVDINKTFKNDITDIVGEIELEYFTDEKHYSNWISNQISMQEAIPKLYAKEVTKATDNIINEISKELKNIDVKNEVAKRINQIKKEAIKKGKEATQKQLDFWARDQTGHFVANQTKGVFKKHGLERYIWITMNDGRVRESHASLHGLEFYFGDSPIGYEPGEDYACRCGYEIVREEAVEIFLLAT